MLRHIIMEFKLFTHEEFNVNVLRELAEAKTTHERLSNYPVKLYDNNPVYKAIMVGESQNHIDRIIKQLDLTFLN